MVTVSRPTVLQVMYCWLHKVASSFWMWMFLWIKVWQLPCHHQQGSHTTPVQEGKEPEAGKRPYTIQYSMKPTSAKMYHTVVQKYSNIILGR